MEEYYIKGKKKMLACIEICPEEWSNRLMVTELWVADELRSQGFELLGYDTCCYTNRDIERHEIRLNFGYFMDNRAGRR